MIVLLIVGFLLQIKSPTYGTVITHPSCRTGFWGKNCDKPCGIHCRFGCYRLTGYCQDCSYGYWGQNCNLLCPKNCEMRCLPPFEMLTDWTSDGCGAECQQDDGKCNGCQDKQFWGVYCNESCSQVIPNCEKCTIDGETCFKCKSEHSCNQTCTNCKVCENNVKCQACFLGFWGENCDTLCPVENCLKCNRNTGICEQCLDGSFGENCTNMTCKCNNCAHCSAVLGICETCVDGYWGTNCDIRCADGCHEQRCEKFMGSCKTCKPLFWGESCNESCIVDNCNSIGSCSKATGPSCYTCVSGKWGERCSKDCSERCANGCSISDGECLMTEDTSTSTSFSFSTQTHVTSSKVQLTEGVSIDLIVGISIGCAFVVGILVVVVTLSIVRFIFLRNKVKLRNYQSKRVPDGQEAVGEIASPDDVDANGTDYELSHLKQELAEVTREELALKQRKCEELRKRLNEKKEMVLKLKGEMKATEGLYEIPVINEYEQPRYESLRD